MSTTENPDTAEGRTEAEHDGRLGRRVLMFGGAAGLAGAAVAALGNPSPAGADYPGSVVLGNGQYGPGNNALGNQTSIESAVPASGGVLNIYSTESQGGVAIYGQAHASSNANPNGYNGAVIGDSDQVDGVLGFSSGGVGVHGVTTADAGIGADTVGVLGEDNSTVPGGTGVYGSSVHGHGVQGVTLGSAGFAGVHGKAIGPGAYGVFGESLKGLGVLGVTHANGNSAVEGMDSSSGGGYGLRGVSTHGVGVQAQGGHSQLYLVPASTAGAPTSGSHLLGEMFLDKNGNLYLCKSTGTPGSWKLLG